MDSKAISLVFTSALIHATWNVVSKSLKGNTAILVIAHFIGALLNLFLAYLLENDFYQIYQQSSIYYLLIPSILAHGLYVLLLAAAYVYGDVGLVYPIARGFAILLATTIGQILEIDKPLRIFQLLGICVVLLGIILLCIDAQNNNYNDTTSNTKDNNVVLYDKVDSSENDIEINNSSDIIDDNVEIEMTNQKFNISNNKNNDNNNNNADNDNTEGIETIAHGQKVETNSELPLLVNEQYQAQQLVVNEQYQAQQLLVMTSQKRTLTSIALALLGGLCTAIFSLLDSQGVLVISALSYSGWLNLYSSAMLFPYIFVYHWKDTMEIYSKNLKYLLIMAPSTCGAYLIILFVFEIPNIDVALVVTFREFSVIIGALLGGSLTHSLT